ncbi:MAG TPA: thiamine diphosphokinase [Bacteroidota bacterium]|nr:thiamine diphosphokinase [Bacteroidota bacterium]
MHALIIANGTLPPRNIVDTALSTADFIICADGGANHARRLKIIPHLILGDFDSILPSTRRFFQEVQQRRIADQGSTDLEKAIRFSLRHNFTSADILGGLGSRIDHTTGALGCFRKFGERINLRFIDPEGEITLIRKAVTFPAKRGEKISLIPFTPCKGITTRRLRYPLHNGALELGVREGISNEATGTPVSISVRSGVLLLYRFRNSPSPVRR